MQVRLTTMGGEGLARSLHVRDGRWAAGTRHHTQLIRDGPYGSLSAASSPANLASYTLAGQALRSHSAV